MNEQRKYVLLAFGLLCVVILLTVLIYLLVQSYSATSQGYEEGDTTLEQFQASDVELPSLTIATDSEFLTEEVIRGAFEKYYPYFVYFLGEPNDFDRGLHWTWDSTLEDWSDFEERGIDNFVSSTNSVYLGRVSGDDRILGDSSLDDMRREIELARFSYGFMHETAHMFFQYDQVPIAFDFGQWLWEGEALAAESLTRRVMDEMGSTMVNYDTTNMLGTIVNGSMQDGLKFNRSITDSSATNALVLLSDVLSTPGTNDFTRRVNTLKVQVATEKGSSRLTKEEYSNILDEASDGKLIDGKSASTWLFSQAVADTEGPLGSYFGIMPSRVMDDFDVISLTAYGFERTAGEGAGMNPELGFKNIPVRATLYDHSANEVGNVETTFQEDGISTVEIPLENRSDLPTGVYKVVGESEYEGQTLESISYGIYGGESLRLDTNNLAFILLNTTGTEILTDMEGKITVEGGTSVNADYLSTGLLIVECDQGDNITLKYGNTSVTYSKPGDTRVIPVKITL